MPTTVPDRRHEAPNAAPVNPHSPQSPAPSLPPRQPSTPSPARRVRIAPSAMQQLPPPPATRRSSRSSRPSSSLNSSIDAAYALDEAARSMSSVALSDIDKLTRRRSSRAVSDSSGRTVEVDEELVKRVLCITCEEFEEELRDAFSVVDSDGDGKITARQLYGMTSRQGFPLSESTITIVVSIGGCGDGFMNFQEYLKFSYDILAVQCELERAKGSTSFKETLPIYRRKSVVERQARAAAVINEDPRVARIFTAWDRDETGRVNVSELLTALNTIPEVNWSGSALRAALRALLKFDDKAANCFTLQQFPSVLADLCAEELSTEFELIADQLVAIAEGREDLETIPEEPWVVSSSEFAF